MNSELQEMASRIREAMVSLGGLKAYSDASGIAERTIANWVSAKSEPKAVGLRQISNLTGFSTDWLLTGEGPKYTAERSMQSNATLQTGPFVGVPRYNAAASAGHGAFTEYAELVDYIPFTEAYLLKRLGRSNTDGLIIVDADGDSMEPTIDDGSLLMIDTHKKQLTAAIFAFTHEDHFFVKRLNILPDAIEAVSDNKAYAPFIIKREQMNRVDILGRVVWIAHSP